MKTLNKLDAYEMPDTCYKFDGYDRKTVPEPTSQNMFMLLDKINELVDIVNDLVRKNNAMANSISND